MQSACYPRLRQSTDQLASSGGSVGYPLPSNHTFAKGSLRELGHTLRFLASPSGVDRSSFPIDPIRAKAASYMQSTSKAFDRTG